MAEELRRLASMTVTVSKDPTYADLLKGKKLYSEILFILMQQQVEELLCTLGVPDHALLWFEGLFRSKRGLLVDVPQLYVLAFVDVVSEGLMNALQREDLQQ